MRIAPLIDGDKLDGWVVGHEPFGSTQTTVCADTLTGALEKYFVAIVMRFLRAWL